MTNIFGASAIKSSKRADPREYVQGRWELMWTRSGNEHRRQSAIFLLLPALPLAWPQQMLEGALTPCLRMCQSAGLQFPLDFQLIGNCQKRPVVPCRAGLISSSFRVRAGNEHVVAGRKGIIPGAWLWWKGHASISSSACCLPAQPWQPGGVPGEASCCIKWGQIFLFLVKWRIAGWTQGLDLCFSVWFWLWKAGCWPVGIGLISVLCKWGGFSHGGSRDWQEERVLCG